jgi:HPt (histidine-containing phosphotransfer) domain-containing protein
LTSAESFTTSAAVSSHGYAPEAEAVAGELVTDFGEACDRATLDELRSEGDGLLADLVALFQTELTKQLGELIRALAAGDCPVVARIAHTLKGTAGTFGAERMQAMAARLDQAARAGETAEATAMVEEFRAECERVRHFLAAEVNEA